MNEEKCKKTHKVKPNIVIMFSDQQRWDTVGCYGQKLDVTPNLDQMAMEGVRFNYAFTCQPVCGPARACLQTGLYATETGCVTNGIALPTSIPTLAKHLNKAGYETAYIGKWHLASSEAPLADDRHPDINYRTKAIPEAYRGGYKDFWLASDALEHTSHGYGGHMFNADMEKVFFNHYRADATTDFALDYLENRKTDRPFFMMVSYIEPHHQNDSDRYEGPNGSKEKFATFETPGDLEGKEGNWKENYPDYLGCCNSIDKNLGRIRASLKEQGIEDNTLILYTSDHGSHFKTRNDEYKRSCHESSIRIPMIAFGPGFKGGKIVDHLTSLIDLPVSILEAAGVKRPNGMKGQLLQKTLTATDDELREEVFIQISENHVGRAIRTKRWKYSVKAVDLDGWLHSGSARYCESCLYDLVADPHESCNLVEDSEFKDIRNKLSKKLVNQMLAAGETAPDIYPYE